VNEEDWPPCESPALWVWLTPQGGPVHFPAAESVILDKEQAAAEERRKKRARKRREFGFR